MNSSLKYLLSFFIRFVVYAGIMVVLNLIFVHDAQTSTSTGKFGEVSYTEIFQEIFLFLLGIIFLWIGRTDRSIQLISTLASLFFFMAFIREFNNQIEYWFYLVLPLLLLFLWIAFRGRKKIIIQLESFLKIPASAYLVIGFLVTFIFSRFFGRTSFWTAVLESDYNRWAKNAAEEGIELLGYALLLIGGIEILWHVLQDHRKHLNQ